MNLASVICVKKETPSERFKREYLSIFLDYTEEPNLNRNVLIMSRQNGKTHFTEQIVRGMEDRDIYFQEAGADELS